MPVRYSASGEKIPKVITGKCGHRCEHMYLRSGLGGANKFVHSGKMYCPICDKTYCRDEVEFERTIRFFVEPSKGRKRGPFVISIPSKIRLKRPDKRGIYQFSEEEHGRLKAQLEKVWGISLKEVIVDMEVGGLASQLEGRLIPNEVPLKKRVWGVPYDRNITDYDKIEKKLKRIRNKAAQVGKE